MPNLTIEQLDLKASDIKQLLDEPVQKYLKTETIIALYTRAYNTIGYQITIDAANQTVVKDAIYAISAWHAFGSYGNSISSALKLQDVEAYEANLRHYKEIAMAAAALIGVDLLKEGNKSDPPLSDSLPIIATGASMLDVE